MTYPHTTSHISLNIPSVFRHSHNNMVRSAEERFAVERMATRGFGSKKIAAALGVPEATTKRWLRRLRSDGDMASRNIGQKNVINTSFDTPWYSPQTLTEPQRQTTRGKTLLFCYTSPYQKFREHLNLKMGQVVPKTLIPNSPGPLCFFTTVPQMVENTVQK